MLMKKTLSLVLSAVMMTALLSACGAENASSTAEKETAAASAAETKAAAPATEDEIIDPSNPPARVDLRNFNGKNYVTPVKRQIYGDCWTFSLAGSAEIAYLVANDLGVPAGEENKNVNFSEKYIAWYLYHGITKDDFAKGKVRASQVGEGFDCTGPDADNPNAVFFFGGEFIHNANLFGSGFGPVDESVTVNDDKPYQYTSVASLNWTLPVNAAYRNAPAAAFLRESRYLQSPASRDKDGKYAFDEEALNTIKAELCMGHGVSLAYNASLSAVNVKNLSAYYGGDEPADHAVTVVGYDDNFPKENFSKGTEDASPEGNGALIIKNSWGVSGKDGVDDGYVYLSYYDRSIVSVLSFVFDRTDTLKSTAFNYDQYDLLMTEWYATADYEAETKMANVFDAEEDENLYQISYITCFPDANVSYAIYKGVEDGNPSSGTLLESGTNPHSFAGSHKIDLKSVYPLKKGEKYAVVLTVTRTQGDNGTVYTELFPYTTEICGTKVQGIVNKGESYLFADGKWSDMADSKDSLIERAFKQGVDEFGDRKTMTEIKRESKDTFVIDNYPIKAILIQDGK